MTTEPSTTDPTPTVPGSDLFHNTLPRITIKYCTQCKWLLRAAYFAQELLSTFNTQLGEVALVPATGGIFTVTIYHHPSSASTTTSTEDDSGERKAKGITATILWDRKTNGGFPETKVLKGLVRNVVDPGRDLGHTDRALRASASKEQEKKQESQGQKEQNQNQAPKEEKEKCEECQ
ncbi:SelT/SelW/SelH family protein [Aspergillus ibericus CBS 121593]|uniref:Selenoprotein domain protein n=1 Tax=Aspergillus ibericus CBS 121593 TaxID=1448316 RepID=A0A395GY47_9EURO|nr:hypothetical protein BO80DRAFT_425677 [Aspergillus ibericus CBS 121593]RAL00511.1 hypothetical protein BO80DRAFT_425677 [Aspergillus ibericus CBS 121593]